MKIDLYAGKHVLYKKGNSNWMVGVIDHSPAEVKEDGVWFSIIPQEFTNLDPMDVPYVHHAELNSIYTEGFKIDPWTKENSEYFMSKAQYLEFIKDERFESKYENAYVSDGEYGYYPISNFSKVWLEKQPFDYIVRDA